jgi:thiosulfate/3-mercaptopyruvate sulfurtransferase
VDAQAGHVPGALNAPFREHVDGSGRWRSPEDLAERFAGLGLDGSAPVAAYCGSGVTACSVVLALEQAGASTRQRPASLYPGSWSEWAADPGRPVRTGDEPG